MAYDTFGTWFDPAVRNQNQYTATSAGTSVPIDSNNHNDGMMSLGNVGRSGGGMVGYSSNQTYGMPAGYSQQAIMDAQNAANAANEQRYQQMLGLAKKYGTTSNQNINQWQRKTQASTQASLSDRGLGNTTVVDTMKRGVTAEANRQRNEVGENKAMMTAGIIERRTDQAPNLPLYAQLASQPGATNGGVGNANTAGWGDWVGAADNKGFRRFK